MANNAIEGLAKIGILIENKKMTEQEAIDAIACMQGLRKTGLYKNWGFNALADNYEKFKGGKPEAAQIKIACDMCSDSKTIDAAARNNHKGCSCGGRYTLVEE